MCKVGGEQLALYVHGSNAMFVKGVKRSVLSKLKILWKKKPSRKIAKNCLKKVRRKENVWQYGMHGAR